MSRDNYIKYYSSASYVELKQEQTNHNKWRKKIEIKQHNHTFMLFMIMINI